MAEKKVKEAEVPTREPTAEEQELSEKVQAEVQALEEAAGEPGGIAALKLMDQYRQALAEMASTSRGIRGRYVPVPQNIQQDAVMLISEPEVPTWWNPDKEREEENPANPDYLKALAEYEQEQVRAAYDVWAMWGFELEPGEMEKQPGWLDKLRLMEMMGRMDLSKFDLDNPVHLEFLFKRYIALGNMDMRLIGAISGLNPQEVNRAQRGFPGNEAR